MLKTKLLSWIQEENVSDYDMNHNIEIYYTHFLGKKLLKTQKHCFPPFSSIYSVMLSQKL